MSSHELGLSAELLLALREGGRRVSKPVQRDAIPLPKDRQSLPFSATLPKELRHLARRFSSAPVRIEAAHRVWQVIYPPARGRAPASLAAGEEGQERVRRSRNTPRSAGAQSVSRGIARSFEPR